MNQFEQITFLCLMLIIHFVVCFVSRLSLAAAIYSKYGGAQHHESSECSERAFTSTDAFSHLGVHGFLATSELAVLVMHVRGLTALCRGLDGLGGRLLTRLFQARSHALALYVCH